VRVERGRGGWRGGVFDGAGKAPVRVLFLLDRSEGSLGPVQEAVQRRTEHMFVRLRSPADGTVACPNRRSRPTRPPPPAPYAAEPSDDHTSNLAAIRFTTSVVNSVVPAWPPRSGVLIPAATVSKVDS
jgi:hypothetical protein